MQCTLLIEYQQTHSLLRITNDFSIFCTSWSGGGLCFGGDRLLYLLFQTKRGTWSFPDERWGWVRGWKRDHPGGRGEWEAELESYKPRCGAWLESGFHRKLKLKTNPDQMEMAGSRRGKPLLRVHKQFVWLKISVFHSSADIFQPMVLFALFVLVFFFGSLWVLLYFARDKRINKT